MNKKFQIRAPWQFLCQKTLYSPYNREFITIALHHEGSFKRFKGKRVFSHHSVTSIDYISVRNLSYELLSEIATVLGYIETPYFYYHNPAEDMDYGIVCLQDESDFRKYIASIRPNDFNDSHTIYMETGQPTVLLSYPQSLTEAPTEKLCQLLRQFVSDNPDRTAKDAYFFLLGKYDVRFSLDSIKPAIKFLKETLELKE